MGDVAESGLPVELVLQGMVVIHLLYLWCIGQHSHLREGIVPDKLHRRIVTSVILGARLILIPEETQMG